MTTGSSLGGIVAAYFDSSVLESLFTSALFGILGIIYSKKIMDNFLS